MALSRSDRSRQRTLARDQAVPASPTDTEVLLFGGLTGALGYFAGANIQWSEGHKQGFAEGQSYQHPISMEAGRKQGYEEGRRSRDAEVLFLQGRLASVDGELVAAKAEIIRNREVAAARSTSS